MENQGVLALMTTKIKQLSISELQIYKIWIVYKNFYYQADGSPPPSPHQFITFLSWFILGKGISHFWGENILLSHTAYIIAIPVQLHYM